MSPRDDEGKATRRLVSRVRAGANVLLLIGAIVLLVSFATHWPPEIIAPIGLLTLTMLVLSFFAIVIENRMTPDEEDGHTP